MGLPRRGSSVWTSRRRWPHAIQDSIFLYIFAYLTFFEVGEEELSEWRLKHRESVRRERGEQAGKGAESHDEVVSF